MASWIQTYLDYTSAQESPEEFHLFSGLSVIASVLNRQTWIPRVSQDGVERYRIFPGQLVTVLVADSGFLRKTTAVDIAHDFMKLAGVQLFEGKISHERLLTKLGSFKSGNAILTVVAGELETFISKANYHDGLVGTLIKLFDARDDNYETQKGGQIPLKNISLTILAATNPRSVGNALPSQSQEQGFQSRCLFVYSDHSNKSPDPLTTDPNALDPLRMRLSMERRTELINGLKRISQLRGEFKLSQDARDWYNAWYARYSKSLTNGRSGWSSRRGDHLTRLGMLLEAGSTYSLDVSVGSLMSADSLLEKYVESHFEKTFAFIGRHASADQQDRVLEVFKLYALGSPVGVSEVAFRTRRFFRNANELNEVLQFLCRGGILQYAGVDPQAKDEYYRLVREP